MIDTFLGLVRPGDVVWDVGANFGFYSILAAAAVGPTGRVVSFDPHPLCLADVRANAELNGFRWLQEVGVALGAVTSEMRLAGTVAGTDGTHRVVPLDSAAAGPEFTVSVVRGDDWARSHPDLKSTVLKLDVEGAELDVLAGLTDTLKDAGCRAVIAEIHFAVLHNTGRDAAPQEIVRLLRSAGFRRIKWVDASHLAATRE
ncbi:MAG: FkbM family methyltransferase [Gemmataceae bacterium]